MRRFFAGFLVAWLCLGLLQDVEAQVLVLKPGEYVKVEARIDEKVPEDKYSPEFGIGDVGLNVYKNSFIVQETDSMTLFYLWRPEGVLRVTSRKADKSYVPKEFKPKQIYPLKEVFSSVFYDVAINFSKVKESASCLTDKYWQTDSNKYFTKYFEIGDCPVYIVEDIKQNSNRAEMYKIIRVEFFRKIKNKEKIADILNYNFIEPDYYFSHHQLGLNDGSNYGFYDKVIRLNPRDKIYRLHGIYRELAVIYNKLPKSAYQIPLLTINDLQNLQPFIGPLPDTATWKSFTDDRLVLNKIYKLQPQIEYGCIVSYTIHNPKMIYEKLGYVVIPDKFFLSRRLKIVSVDDIPWETYKKQLCEMRNMWK